jgi:hypothetical protein
MGDSGSPEFQPSVARIFFQFYNPSADSVPLFKFQPNERFETATDPHEFHTPDATYALQEDISEGFSAGLNARGAIGEAIIAMGDAARDMDPPEALVLVPVRLAQITPATDQKKIERRKRVEMEQELKEKADERQWRKVEECRAQRQKKEEEIDEARRSAREARVQREAKLPEGERQRRERAMLRELGKRQEEPQQADKTVKRERTVKLQEIAAQERAEARKFKPRPKRFEAFGTKPWKP